MMKTSGNCNVRGKLFDPSRLPKVGASTAEEVELTGANKIGSSVRIGALWSAGGTIVLRFGNVAIMAIVARILAPEEFGIFALAITLHAFLVSLAELGIAASIARLDLDAEKIAPTVNTLAMGTALALAIPMALFSDQLASLLGSTAAASTIRILSIGVALIGPLAVPGAMLQRTFKQRQIFIASISGFIPGNAFLVFAVLNGGNVEALAWSRVISQVLSGLVMCVCVGRMTRLGIDWRLVCPLLAFGLPLASANFLSQVLLNVDNLFVGRLLGVEALGAYSIAFSVSVWSTAVLGTMLNSVVLPGVSAVIRVGGDVATAVYSAIRIVTWIAAPIAAVTFAFASPVIRTVYGEQWEASGPVLRTLAIYGFVFVVGLLLANVIIATGKTTVLLWVQLAAFVALIPALPIGIRVGGLEGAGWAHVIVVTVVTLPIYLMALRRAIGCNLVKVISNILPNIGISAACAAISFLLTLGIENAPLKTLAGGLICAGLYLACTWPTVREILLSRRNRTLNMTSRKASYPQ